MTFQSHTPDMATAISSTSSSSADTGYFAVGSKYSTPETTPATTPGHHQAESPASKVLGNPLPALSRDFPRPVEEIDVKSALERQPGRWTIKGQMEANMRRAQPSADDETAAKEKRARDFEAAKKDLLASHGSLRAQLDSRSA